MHARRDKKLAFICGAIFIILFFTLVNILGDKTVWGYDSKVAHPNIARLAAELYNQRANVDLSAQDIEIIARGAEAEDTPFRWYNHFYDPIYDQGIWFGKQYFTAKTWAVNSRLQNDYALGDQSWNRALYEYSVGNRAAALTALGHVIHLLSDMAVPAHTRDDIHPAGDAYEQFIKTNWDSIYPVIKDKITYKEVLNVDAVFDVLATFSNGYFYSDDTIEDQKYQKQNIVSYKVIDQNTGNPLLFAFGDLDYPLYVNANFNDWKVLDTDYKINHPTVLTSYATQLIPKAIGYSAGLINLFFTEIAHGNRGQDIATLQITPTGYSNTLLGMLGNGIQSLWSEIRNDGTIVISPSESLVRSSNNIEKGTVLGEKIFDTSLPTSIPTPSLPVVLPVSAPIAPITIAAPVISSIVSPSASLINIDNISSPPSLPVVSHPATPTPVNPLSVFSYGGGSSSSGSSAVSAVATSVISDSAISGETVTSVTTSIILATTTTSTSVTSTDIFVTTTLDGVTTTLDTSSTTSEAPTVSSTFDIPISTTTIDIATTSISSTTLDVSTTTSEIVSTTIDVSTSTSPTDTTTATSTVTTTGEIFSPTTTPTSTAPVYPIFAQEVVINEIAWAGTSAAYPTHEWIELYNPTDHDIVLFSSNTAHSWRLKIGDRYPDPCKINNPVIPAHGFYLMERTNDDTVRQVTADYTFALSYGISNSGTKIQLLKPDGTISDEVDCTNGWFSGDTIKYRTMERLDWSLSGSDPANWQSNRGPRFLPRSYNGDQIYGSPQSSNTGGMIALNTTQNDETVTLTKVDNPYILGCYTVPAGKRLIIEAGVIIKTYASYGCVDIYGALQINGTAAEPVVFTSGRDLLPDANFIGQYSPGAPLAKDWRGIRFLPGAVGNLYYLDMRYAGKEFYPDGYIYTVAVSEAIRSEGANLNIQNSKFLHNGPKFIHALQGTNLVIENSIFADGGLALQVDGGTIRLNNNDFLSFTEDPPTQVFIWPN